jgi:hypothetical protein
MWMPPGLAQTPYPRGSGGQTSRGRERVGAGLLA